MLSLIWSMLPSATKFINLKWLAVLGVVLFLGLWVNWSLNMKEEAGTLAQQVEQQQTEIKNVKRNATAEINSFKHVINQQHETLKKLQAEGNQNKQEITNLQITIVEQQKEYNAEITNILKRPRPQDCRNSIDYLKKEAGGIKW